METLPTGPKFESFRLEVYFKPLFTDSMHIEQVLCVLEGKAKRSIESIGISGIFYATVLRTLERDVSSHK